MKINTTLHGRTKAEEESSCIPEHVFYRFHLCSTTELIIAPRKKHRHHDNYSLCYSQGSDEATSLLNV